MQDGKPCDVALGSGNNLILLEFKIFHLSLRLNEHAYRLFDGQTLCLPYGIGLG
ncbi:MAG: DUF1655 domain-containing protein [Deltaproteobacteria bacterium]|nr:DUF1655 domain-containing protein [Deltaproteobacteria bacterium]MBW2019835.1 DUF1655 domain-containing protein [Deltaproteobacteria bacterium]MBW2074639.1 DUF1655 domain-containing protein [Deltaproteobacteria bacterium]